MKDRDGRLDANRIRLSRMQFDDQFARYAERPTPSPQAITQPVNLRLLAYARLLKSRFFDLAGNTSQKSSRVFKGGFDLLAGKARFSRPIDRSGAATAATSSASLSVSIR